MLRYRQVASGIPVRESWGWVPSLGLDLSFVLDGLSLTFALLVTLIGAVVLLYASTYLRHYEEADRFFGFIGMFMTSMLGVVLSDNLLLLGNVTGSFEISSFYAMNDMIVSHRLYLTIGALILVGAFTKSAQFPFHFWLPDAMAAPSPVSAYLHSATMLKAGIYLIARFNHEIGGTDLWQDSILVAGATTMILAGLLSYRQSDLKRLLACSTLSVLGTLVMLLGIGSKLAYQGLFHLPDYPLALQGHAVSGSWNNRPRDRNLRYRQAGRSVPSDAGDGGDDSARLFLDDGGDSPDRLHRQGDPLQGDTRSAAVGSSAYRAGRLRRAPSLEW